MSPEPLDPDLITLANQLSAMPIAGATLARDRLLFLAGQAAVGRRRRAWLTAAAVLLTTTSLVAGAFLGRSLPREPVIVERLIPGPAIPPPPPEPPPFPANEPSVAPAAIPSMRQVVGLPGQLVVGPPGQDDLFGWRQRLVERDALPPATAPAVAPPPNVPLEELLNLPAGAIGPTERRRWQAALHPGDPL